MELDDVKIKLEELNIKLKEVEKSINIPKVKQELEELESKTSNPGFWNDNKESGKVVSNIKDKREELDKYAKLNSLYSNSLEIYNLLLEENILDKEMYKEMTNNISELENMLENIEQSNLFSSEYDNMNAIVTVHPRSRRN